MMADDFWTWQRWRGSEPSIASFFLLEDPVSLTHEMPLHFTKGRIYNRLLVLDQNAINSDRGLMVVSQHQTSWNKDRLADWLARRHALYICVCIFKIYKNKKFF